MTRKYNILTKTKQRKFNKDIWGFDVETYSNKNKFLCCSLYKSDDEVYFFTNKRECINFLKTKKFINSWIVATNLQFDFFKLFEDEPEQYQFNILIPNSNMIYAKAYIYDKQFHTTNKNKNSKGLTFVDTLNYSTMSVQKIGEIINIPKMKHPICLGKIPKNETEWQEIKEYNINDSKISCEFLRFIANAFLNLGCNIKYTIASSSMSLFRNKYLDRDIFQPPINILEEHFKSYYGGRTEVFKRGKIENCNLYDINSMYPYVMTKEFPDPNTMKISKRNTIEYIKKFHGISNVDIYCPENINIPLLPLKLDGKLIFPVGTFTGWYTHVELIEALNLGYVIKRVYKTYYYKKTFYPFKDFVNTMYNLRLKYKEDNSPLEFVVKIIMNSLYGKFGQKFDSKSEFIPMDDITFEITQKYQCERIGNYMRIKKGNGRPAIFCIPMFASYVTSYSRIELYKYLKDSEPIYCDTDSIITKHQLENSKELGKLKLEFKIDNGFIIKPKFYAITGNEFNKSEKTEKVKIKGVQKNIKIKGVVTSLNYLSFNNILINPSVVFDKFTKFRESIRRGFVVGEIIEVIKNLQLEDTKRIYKNDSIDLNILEDSRPINMNNQEELNLLELKIKQRLKEAREKLLNEVESKSQEVII